MIRPPVNRGMVTLQGKGLLLGDAWPVFDVSMIHRDRAAARAIDEQDFPARVNHEDFYNVVVTNELVTESDRDRFHEWLMCASAVGAWG